MTGNPNRPVSDRRFSREELRVIVEEAISYGKSVRCHANFVRAIMDALLAGVSAIEHGFFITEDCLHLMAERNVLWVLTIFALRAYSFGIIDSIKRRYIDAIIEAHILL